MLRNHVGVDRRSSLPRTQPNGASIITNREQGISALLRGKIFFDEALIVHENLAFNTITVTPHTPISIMNNYQDTFVQGRHRSRLSVTGQMEMFHEPNIPLTGPLHNVNAPSLHNQVSLFTAGPLKAVESSAVAPMESPPAYNTFTIDKWAKTPAAVRLNPRWLSKIDVDNSLMNDFMKKLQRGKVVPNNLKSLGVEPQSEQSIENTFPVYVPHLSYLQCVGSLLLPQALDAKKTRKYFYFIPHKAHLKYRVITPKELITRVPFASRRYRRFEMNNSLLKFIGGDRSEPKVMSISLRHQGRPANFIKGGLAHGSMGLINPYNKFVHRQPATDLAVSQTHSVPQVRVSSPLFHSFSSFSNTNDPSAKMKFRELVVPYPGTPSYLPPSIAYHVRPNQSFHFNQPLHKIVTFNKQVPSNMLNYDLLPTGGRLAPLTRRQLVFGKGMAESGPTSNDVHPPSFYPAPLEHLSPDIVQH
ncbi:uncharacterized protein LOC111251664 isoform X3 [Varroa destructor]|nr:uncharacterized protein LOC111251664 isoform X3 [Varroa destructor]XP_022664186.1 uncharacterized protein LOC111251664 isoform X3 [Varroa destructor]XP_022664187.1 uncharacterized protein LOC111251664 isoform X3 [Varroa destructor]XP_022664188.1 uncharacterized protein LOC111251664 isoform X3 [Varroa destructor]XP_022664189.1 uncharacterized protein LOC111251664 isoform X3 [Varroa destructor]XP_022664190.1 uncharacterized protein LOC111251664 isoform X3 [Varroa destructor]XP_022664191.1 un